MIFRGVARIDHDGPDLPLQPLDQRGTEAIVTPERVADPEDQGPPILQPIDQFIEHGSIPVAGLDHFGSGFGKNIGSPCRSMPNSAITFCVFGLVRNSTNRRADRTRVRENFSG